MIETVQTVELICERCNKAYTALPSYYPTWRKYCKECRKIVNKEKWGKDHHRRVVVKEDSTVILRTHKPKSNYKEEYADWYNAGFVAGSYGDLRERFREIYIKCKGFMVEARDALYREEAYKIEVKGLSEDERCAWLLGFINQAIDGELNCQIC